METFRFRNFQVYKDAKKLNTEIFRMSASLPLELKSQLIRSSISVTLNVGEGSAKKSDRDFNRYVENALGSINETVAILEIAFELRFISRDQLTELLRAAESIAKQLGGLSKKLKSS